MSKFTEFFHVHHDISAIKPAYNVTCYSFAGQTDDVKHASVQATILADVFFHMTKSSIKMLGSTLGLYFFIKKQLQFSQTFRNWPILYVQW